MEEETQKATAEEQASPSKPVKVVLWFFTVLLVLCVVAYFPSSSSVILLAAALVVCPLGVVRNFTLFKNTFGRLPGPLFQDVVRIAIAALLFMGGLAFTHLRGGDTLVSFVDLQLAQVRVTNDLEYTTQSVSLADYLECSSKFAKLASEDGRYAKKVGAREVSVEIVEGPFSKFQDVVLRVHDTQPPVIKVDSKKITASMGETIRIADHIVLVEDPVDGSLTEVKSKPEPQGTTVGEEQFYDEGWFIIQGKVDTTKVGKQKVVILAEDKHGNQASQSITVSIDDPLDGVKLTPKTSVLEYAAGKTDATKLVTCSVADAKVEASELDLSTVGEKTVTYTITKGGAKRELTQTFTVSDTKKPEIKLRKDEVSLAQGGSFDPYENVLSVRDEVDGDLKRAQDGTVESGTGWFAIEGEYNTGTVGKQTLTVVACDKNGNRTEKKFTLVVTQKTTPSSTASQSRADTSNNAQPAAQEQNANADEVEEEITLEDDLVSTNDETGDYEL